MKKDFLIILLLSLPFVGWISFYEIDEGVPVLAEVKLVSAKLTTQYSNMGIIKSIKVKDNSKVKANDILLTLDDSQIAASISALELALKEINKEIHGKEDLSKEGLISKIEIDQLKVKREDLVSKIKNLKVEHDRTIIKSPYDGQVINMASIAVGSVVNSSQKLFEIVPDEKKILLESKVLNLYIDQVKVGQNVDIRFTGFRNTPLLTIDGVIQSISEDAIEEPQKQSSTDIKTYTAKIAITDSGFEQLGSREIQPGMQAQVLIKSGKRTVLDYLIAPIYKRASQSLVEP